MPLQLTIISEHGDILGDDRMREFRENGGTIGRSYESDWILPDPDRLMSGKHATVDFQSGAYYLVDVSTNGVYVNGEREPLGRGNPRRLFNGDKLRMGEFEFEVSLDEGYGLGTRPLEEMTIVPGQVERLIGEEALKTGVDLLGEEAMSSDEEFKKTLFGNSAKEIATEENNRKFDNRANPFAPTPTNDEVKRIDLEMVLDAFMQGLDISRADIHPSTDPLDVMENAGRLLKAFIDGTSDLLARRTALKTMFQLDQTTILPQQNNPLKLAEDSRESIMQLLIGKEGQYLGSVDAVREVCQDLKFHHDAVLEAMMSAFAEFVGRFEPDKLQENFDRTLDKKPLFRALNELKYWQLYRDLYPIMTQRRTGAFPHQFGENFVHAYDNYIAECNRAEHAADRQKTQAIKEQAPVSYDKEELVDQTKEASYRDQF